MKKKQPYEKFSGVTTNTAIYYHGVDKPDQSRLLTDLVIGDYLDLEVDGDYPCSDGSTISTISVDALIDKVASIKDAEFDKERDEIYENGKREGYSIGRADEELDSNARIKALIEALTEFLDWYDRIELCADYETSTMVGKARKALANFLKGDEE